ncbi:MAG: prolyl oligopeptidase family protein [Acidobacteriota bacterium]
MRLHTVLLLGWASTLAVGAQVSSQEEDPYIWLEEVQGEKAMAWVKEQNQRTVAELEAVPEFQGSVDRFLSILDSREKIAYPSLRGKYVYNFWQDTAHVRGIWRRTTLDDYLKPQPNWQTLLDIDALAEAENENWVYKGATCLYPEYRHCMISLSRGGADAVVLREFDTETRSFVPNGFRLPEAKSRVNWKDQDTLWVGTDFGPGSLTRSGYPRIAKEWKRGRPLEQAGTVFEGKLEDVAAGVQSIHTPEGRYDVATRSPDFFSSEAFLIREGRLIKLDMPADVGDFDIFKKQMLISLRSDWKPEGTTFKQGSLLAIDLERFLSGKRNFRILFQPTRRTSLASFSTTKDLLLVSILDNIASRVYEFRFKAGEWPQTEVPVPGIGAAGVSATSPLSNDYFLTYTDFLTPTTLQLVRGGGPPQTVKTMPVFFKADGLKVEQLQATSADGTRIPYFLVRRTDLKLNGLNPTLLTGYGGFEVPNRPGYRPLDGAGWLEKGGVFAVANIRGGGEFGPRWHQAALKKNRRKAYEDFTAVAQDLIARKITSPQHLGIEGASNGGLLVGAAFTMRPDLFNAVVCQAPLLDMRRYSKLLAGASWRAEYGDPDDLDMWAYIRTYSPYHNLAKDKRYPKVLFTTSTRDDRVHPGHARKMAARMLEQGHPFYFYENTEGGHAGAANNRQRAYMSALAYAYLWKQLR